MSGRAARLGALLPGGSPAPPGSMGGLLRALWASPRAQHAGHGDDRARGHQGRVSPWSQAPHPLGSQPAPQAPAAVSPSTGHCWHRRDEMGQRECRGTAVAPGTVPLCPMVLVSRPHGTLCPPSQGTPRLGVTGPHGAGPQLPRTVPPPWMGTRRRPTGGTGTAPGGAAPRHGVWGVSPTPGAAPAHQAEPQLPVPGPPVCNWANWDRATESQLLPAEAAPVLPSSGTPTNHCLTQGFGPPTPSFRNTPPSRPQINLFWPQLLPR